MQQKILAAMEHAVVKAAPNLGPGKNSERLSRRSRNRLLSLCSDPSLAAALGGAYGMLLYVVKACGDEDGVSLLDLLEGFDGRFRYTEICRCVL